MSDTFAQVWIVFFGCSAIWFVGRLEKWKRWGYILGLCSQPAWLYTSVSHEQWGIALLSLWYTLDKITRYLINTYLVADEWEPDQRKEKIDMVYKRLMEE